MYLAFYKGRYTENKKSRLFDWIVTLFTRSRYSHVELLFNYNEVTGDCIAWSSSFRDGGVRSKIMNVHNNSWEVFQIDVNDKTDEVLERVVPRKGSGYDILGAIGVVVPVVKSDDQRWFCSELVAYALGFPEPESYSPEDLFRAATLVYRSN